MDEATETIAFEELFKQNIKAPDKNIMTLLRDPDPQEPDGVSATIADCLRCLRVIEWRIMLTDRDSVHSPAHESWTLNQINLNSKFGAALELFRASHPIRKEDDLPLNHGAWLVGTRFNNLDEMLQQLWST